MDARPGTCVSRDDFAASGAQTPAASGLYRCGLRGAPAAWMYEVQATTVAPRACCSTALGRGSYTRGDRARRFGYTCSRRNAAGRCVRTWHLMPCGSIAGITRRRWDKSRRCSHRRSDVRRNAHPIGAAAVGRHRIRGCALQPVANGGHRVRRRLRRGRAIGVR